MGVTALALQFTFGMLVVIFAMTRVLWLNELLLFDRDRIFSSEQGWGPTLHQLFPRGLMLLDFDKQEPQETTAAGSRTLFSSV